MAAAGGWRAAGGGSLRTARWVGAGLADQVVSAVANAGITLLGVLLLPRVRADAMVLAVAIGYAAIGLGRAFVGEVLLALAARLEPDRRRDLVRHGLATALGIGTAVGGLLLTLWAVWPRGGRIDLRDLVWVALFLPALLLHDAARYTYLADRRPDRSLQINLAYAGSQAVGVLVLVVAGHTGAAGLLIAWGLGACVGVTVFCVRTGHVPWRGNVRVWFGQTKFLSGWFTVTAVIAQAHGLAINFLLVGRLSRGALAGFKLAQTTMLQPIQNVNQALISLLVPRMSRSAGLAVGGAAPGGVASGGAAVPAADGRRATDTVDVGEAAAGDAAPGPAGTDPTGTGTGATEPDRASAGTDARTDAGAGGGGTDAVGGASDRSTAARTLRREVRRLALAFMLLATALVAVGAPVGHYVLSRMPRFTDVAALALPVLLQGGLYLVQAPFTAALRGMHQARKHLAQYSIYSAASLIGLVAGADLDGLAGAAWGLAFGAAVGLAASILLYAAALRGLGETGNHAPVTALEPEPV